MDGGSDEAPQKLPREAGWRGVKDDEEEHADHALQFGFSPEDEDEGEQEVEHDDVAAALRTGFPALDRRRWPDGVGCDADASPLSATPPGEERLSPHLLPVFADDKPVPRDVTDNDPDALVVSLDEDYVAPTQILEGSPRATTSAVEVTFPPVVKKTSEEDFEQLRLLGRGVLTLWRTQVVLVRHRQTCRVHAMKVLKKASIAIHRKDREHTLTERQVLAAINHPFIVPLYYAFQCDQKLYLILKYASGGELFTHMSNEKMFEEDVAAFYAAEIASALEHLHGLGIIYR
ncbi:MAG: kinase-like domain-containing protein [Olpidium bornovanus]|uniref:Kinase-like domain-containing protein n=1 Tax=Olpidium bornovanus TaxID=278681 RepID=A0A8H7ZM96_9FUNG|nr:MAG: kinase-like domain-containing protein [Olpidium bornovanus]